jgi:carnitine O-acetyltransferase
LKEAIKVHSRLTKDAALGQGIDRHLLGLRLMHEELKPGQPHLIFKDELFGRSQEWKLSTSGLSAGYYFRGTG